MFLLFLANFLLWCFGWEKIDQSTQEQLKDIKKGIYIYPHTSKLDSFFFGLYFLAYPYLFKDTYTLFAKRFFQWPFTSFLSHCNCIPIENKKRNQGQVQKLIDFLSNKQAFKLFLSPKGSSGISEWRSGYIRLAQQLNCPIIVCGLDYEKKIPVITGTFTLNDFDPEKFKLKMKEISSLYPENEPSVYFP